MHESNSTLYFLVFQKINLINSLLMIKEKKFLKHVAMCITHLLDVNEKCNFLLRILILI